MAENGGHGRTLAKVDREIVLNRRVKRALVALALVAAACTQTAAESTTTSLLEAPTAETTAPTTSAPVANIAGCDEAEDDFELFCQAIALIQAHYVDAVPDDDLVAAAVRGIVEFAEDTDASAPTTCALPGEAFGPLCLAIDEADATVSDAIDAALTGIATFALDPNSAYLDPEALAAAQLAQSGEVEGIGALVTTEDRTADDPESTTCAVISETCVIVVVSLLADSPALRAGVLAEDEIVSVNGESILGLTFEDVTNIIRGPAGTPVTVGFLRQGATVEYTITRAALTVPVVEWEMLGSGVGYLRLYFFSQNSDTQVDQALAQLSAEGMETLVLDLRDNPGGSLFAAINIASEFLSDGVVVVTEAPDGDTPYRVAEGGSALDVPLVMVVNRGSASASEVVAAALKEAGRATVVGSRTFGKNTVQQRFSLGNGGAIKLTIARWVTPAGNDFGESGVTPDFAGPFPPELTPAEVADLALELARN